jgi:hypothetical protein
VPARRWRQCGYLSVPPLGQLHSSPELLAGASSVCHLPILHTGCLSRGQVADVPVENFEAGGAAVWMSSGAAARVAVLPALRCWQTRRCHLVSQRCSPATSPGGRWLACP